jgi:hypothetical protein
MLNTRIWKYNKPQITDSESWYSFTFIQCRTCKNIKRKRISVELKIVIDELNRFKKGHDETCCALWSITQGNRGKLTERLILVPNIQTCT